MTMIDLRSDTVTRPTRAMLEAAAAAELGDDVYEEDPTVRRLEQRAAEMMDREAALFLPTATMSNLCALLTHCGRGQRVLCGDETHVFRYEAGGASALGGLIYHPLRVQADGSLDPDELAHALESPDDPHIAPAGVLVLENTLARRGGLALGAAAVRSMTDAAHSHGVPVHLDGARLFNAAVAQGVSVAQLATSVDSVQICLSKGLAAPLGSLLIGTAGFIARARRTRKMLGGGMRQVGVVAAMGLVALDRMPARLHEDHTRALRLATALRTLLGEHLEVSEPTTNMVVLRHRTQNSRSLIEAATRRGVRLSAIDAQRARAVTHLDIDDNALAQAIERLSSPGVLDLG